MRIVMVGSGYVGLVSGACLAEIGHEVTCVDINEEKINKLKDSISPIFEPGIEKLLKQNQEHHRLFFSTNLSDALSNCEIVFIAVGTPPGENGEADLKYVEAVAEEIGQEANNDMLVIVKSNVPVGSCDRVERIINKALKKRNANLNIPVASNPEFLKEGTAISDFMKPDRIVVGLNNMKGDKEIHQLYRPFTIDDPSKLLVVDRKASEMIKYTANAMLATRISFMNELSKLCEKLGVNIDQVRLGVGSDARIGKKFLYAGPGYGGSCFPKDVSALLNTGIEHGCEMLILKSVMEVNEQQKAFTAAKIKNYFNQLKGKTISIWGLSFKPGTDDVREAPSLTIVKNLLAWGAKVVAHDPEAIQTFRNELGEHPMISYVKSAYDAIEGADALVLMTEWGEYRWPNWEKVSKLLKNKVVFDFRNQYEASMLQQLGYHYQCIGRIDSTTGL